MALSLARICLETVLICLALEAVSAFVAVGVMKGCALIHSILYPNLLAVTYNMSVSIVHGRGSLSSLMDWLACIAAFVLKYFHRPTHPASG